MYRSYDFRLWEHATSYLKDSQVGQRLRLARDGVCPTWDHIIEKGKYFLGMQHWICYIVAFEDETNHPIPGAININEYNQDDPRNSLNITETSPALEKLYENFLEAIQENDYGSNYGRGDSDDSDDSGDEREDEEHEDYDDMPPLVGESE